MARPTAEQIYRGMMRGPLTTLAASASNQWAGLTTLSSGSATQVVSTTAVASGDLVLAFPFGATDTASGTGRTIEVKSFDSGNAFHFGTADGIAIPRDTTIMWVAFKTS